MNTDYTDKTMLARRWVRHHNIRVIRENPWLASCG
jgi:hypothetical protein